jgi:hypothetical protein
VTKQPTKVEPKPSTGKPAPKFKAKKKPAARSMPCPSCKAKVLLDADGNPISHDVAHFKKDDTPAPATKPAESPTTAPATPTAPAVEPEREDSFFGRIDRNLTRYLEE